MVSEDSSREREAAADATTLDDGSDRSELRDRYYGLLQELRVVVPGVQVLLAFLLTVPFAQRFGELDEAQQAWFGAALVSASCSVIAFLTPTAMHRLGKRTARGDRLTFSIRTTRIGLMFLGLAMLMSFSVVTQLLFGGVVPILLTSIVGLTMLMLWVGLPLVTWTTDRD